ncbi:MAG: aspartate--tRNA ligase [Candidatus Pacebacteria bacterium]|nr:aspartate--tRNA ligase [Candidatus Paceibacterota bacterium]
MQTYRTHTCGELTKKDKGEKVILSGWVNSRRDHGGLIFVDLRDREGLTQITFDPKVSEKSWKTAENLRNEFVIRIEGKVILRPDDMINSKLKTGEIEVEVENIEILSESKTPPFEVEEIEGVDKAKDVKEDLRMEYRYLDIRRKKMRDNLEIRHKIIKFIRDYLDQKDFWEVETPSLTKSTPEGARDFIVPSRLHQGSFYSLPQSPQQYKQLLMVGGVEKYFQIARCFRDEDQRGNRQLEFTQLDLEMSFVHQDEILNLMEKMMIELVGELSDKEIMFKPFPRLNYDDVMKKYGVDKPDLRYGLEIEDISEIVKGCGFGVFTNAVEEGGVVRAICAKGAAKFSRAEIDKLTESAKEFGAKGLAYIIIKENELQSPIVKFLGDDLSQKIVEKMKGEPGDIIFFGADSEKIVRNVLGQVRIELAKKLNLADENKLAFAFVVNWPLFEEEFENGHFAPAHHMFTMPHKEDLKLLESSPEKTRSYQHDLVLNGSEVAGGSIRIHDRKIQEKIFDLIGFSEEKKKSFEHILKAFEYGPPPHGGIAMGLDRFVMILRGEKDIREVIAFPKSGDGKDLTMGAPSEVEKEQLDELGIKIKKV